MSKRNSIFTFHYQGRFDGWLVLRAPTRKTVKRTSLDAHTFETKVFQWCMSYAGGEHHLANGDAHGYETAPTAFKNGASLVLKFKLLSDLVRFERCFAVEGFGKEQLLMAA